MNIQGTLLAAGAAVDLHSKIGVFQGTFRKRSGNI
jgi:hypothetical protein